MHYYAPRYSSDRFGVMPRSTPRQADLLIVSGTVIVLNTSVQLEKLTSRRIVTAQRQKDRSVEVYVCVCVGGGGGSETENEKTVKDP